MGNEEGELKKQINEVKFEDSEYWGEGEYYIVSRDKMIAIIGEAKKEFPIDFNTFTNSLLLEKWFLKWFGTVEKKEK